MYTCRKCGGSGEIEYSHNGVCFYPEQCDTCHGTGRVEVRFIREPAGDRRIARGDDFAGDAWIDNESGELVYGAVGFDRNTGAKYA